MNKKFVIRFLLVVIIGVGSYFLIKENAKIDREESEIGSLLQAMYESEIAQFDNSRYYVDEVGDFRMPVPKNPSIVGAYPDCKSLTSALPHFFIGPSDETFKAQARAVLESEILKGKCRDLSSGFTAFAGQNLDEDENLELWTIDENGRTDVIFSD